MEKYKKDCNDDGVITCEDYAAIHRRGPRACSNKDLLKDHYWNKFLACRASQKPVKDVSMVKVNEDDPINIDQNILASRGDSVTSSSPSPELSSTSSSTVSTTFPQPPQSSNEHFNSGGGVDSKAHPSSINAYQAPTSFPPTSSSSNRYDSSQAPTYELTSLVLDIKTDNNDQVSNKPLAPQTLDRNHNHHHHHHHHNNNHQLLSNKNYLESSKHKTEVLDSSTRITESVQDYRPSTISSTVSNLSPSTLSRKTPQTDYSEGLPLIIIPKDSSGWAQTNQLPTITSTSGTTSPAYIETMSTTSTITTIGTSNYSPPSSETPSSITSLNKHHFTDSLQQVNHNDDLNPIVNHPNTDSTMSQKATDLPPNSSQSGYQASPEQAMPPVASDEIDYSMPDFPFSGNQGNAASSSFDKVVTGIVGSPDFSKSYPPVPDIVIQADKNTADKTSFVDEQYETTSVNKASSQQKAVGNTNYSRNPINSNNFKLSGQATAQTTADSSQRSSTSKGNHKTSATSNATNRSPSSPPTTVQYNQQSTNDNADNSATNQAPILSSVLGSESINITSLFEKGGLNESSRIAAECLECICDASSNCDTTVQCISKQREKNRCGLYMISWNQFQESDISLTALRSNPTGTNDESADEKLYYECTTDRICAEKLIHLYIEKHQRDCNNDGKIDCYDIAAIHRVGPENCNSSKFLGSQYWKDFNICYATDGLTTTTVQAPS